MVISTLATVQRSPQWVAQLIGLWDKSVRTSHHFLTEAAIQALRPCVREALMEVPLLAVAEEEGTVAGFIGICEDKIEMLFVVLESIGQGVGHALVSWAIYEHGGRYIDVNEQNHHASTIYQHWGFTVYERTPIDDAARPDPVLKMRWGHQPTHRHTLYPSYNIPPTHPQPLPPSPRTI